MLQRAVEEEVTAFLSRARYERTSEARGSRNGNRPRQVQTAEGELKIQVPQIRGAAARFVSSVIPNGRTALRTRPLEALIIGGWVRGLSDRDIESLVSEAGLGQVSKSTVSQITQELRARYRAFREHGLGEVELLVLYLDAIYLPTRPSGAKEGVLVAWGYDETGRRVLLEVVLGQRERFEDWLEMGRGLVRRGLRAPMLVVTDGAPGLIRAVETCFPRALRQRCLVHRLRNLRSKAPESRWPEIALRARGCYEAASPALATVLRDDFVQTYERELPAVVQCFRDDFDACIAHLRFPLRHRRVVRTTNLLERLFLEERRRTKIIPNAFGERPVLKLMYAAVIRAAARWRGIAVGEFEQRQLRAIREELDRAHAERVAPAVAPRSAPSVRKLRADR